MSNNMTEEKKNELLLKAAVKFKGVWPDGATHLLTTGKDWSGSKKTIGDIEPVILNCVDEYQTLDACQAFNIGNDAWVVLCTRAEFEAFVESLFDGAPEGVNAYIIQEKYSDFAIIDDFNRVKLMPSKVCNYAFFAGMEYSVIWQPRGYIKTEEVAPRPPKKQAEAVEWNGEGLPPAGEKVEYTTTEYQSGKPSIEVGVWYVGTIVAYHGGMVWTSDNGLRMLSTTKFRPLKTEAKKEFNELYTKAIATIENDMLNYIGQEYDYRDAVEALLKAKWRPHEKTEEGRNEAIEKLADFLYSNRGRRITSAKEGAKDFATAIYDEMNWRPTK